MGKRAPQTGRDVRLRARSGGLDGQTSGLAQGYVQGNVVILERTLAADFQTFCQRNPKPCPLLAMTEPGQPGLPELGADIDIRTDVPRYRIWRRGELVAEVSEITGLWRSDLVAFVLGCSFSFEEALIESGLELRHLTHRCNVPMFRTSIETAPAGPFRGPMVVSMRPFRPADAIRAIQVTSRFPAVHGAPVHIGLPQAIGIDDLARPDYGDPVPVGNDELPVFWGCGVTPQAVVAAIKPELCITHAPGCMLVTDRLNSSLAVL
ncbi:MAG: putative hydro-lyase [Hyphomicrobiaceae bacterium]|nr:putative hydro-lyase [Hyphomicrobiaceae bacterium]